MNYSLNCNSTFVFYSQEIAESEISWQLCRDIKNYGNTCYINATIQVFLNFPLIQSWLKSHASNEGPVISKLWNLLLILQRKVNDDPKKIIEYLRDRPREFTSKQLLFPAKQQCDAYDFLEALFSMIEED